MKYILITSCVIISFILINCKTEEQVVAETSSFGLIQDKILTKSCAVTGCHASETDENFSQHGLVLAKGKAYKSLFDVVPKNISAKTDKLKLVMPYNSDKSLLYHKLIYDVSHHGGKSYGSVMPLGKDLLSLGQIEFVRRWIEAGAPEEGVVVDYKLLDDTVPSTANYTPLKPPAIGEGFQMKLDEFEVQPNFERELFVRKPLGNEETVYISKFQIKMRPGSHHFILYGFRDSNNLPNLNVIRDLRNTDGSYNLLTFAQMGNHIFNFGASEPNYEYTFPEGTAVELPKDMTFDMNSHYFNKGTKPIKGETQINLFTTPKSNVKQKLKIIDFGNNNLSIKAKTKVTITKDFIFDKNVQIVMLTSHTHKLGELFEILIKGGSRNGEIVYINTDWEHPEKTNYLPYIRLKKGEGLTSRITYNNTSSKNVQFGLTSEDEMGIIFGYYFEE